MARFIEVTLDRRGVRAVARLASEHAPYTSEVLWNALPQSGPVCHAKYARNELFIRVPAFVEVEPGPENTTITPLPGDLLYFGARPKPSSTPAYTYTESNPQITLERRAEFAVFYDRNNLLLNPDFGFSPGNVFGRIESGLQELAAAVADLWLRGAAGETLSFRRLDDD
jgi:hypothetical protein